MGLCTIEKLVNPIRPVAEFDQFPEPKKLKRVCFHVSREIQGGVVGTEVEEAPVPTGGLGEMNPYEDRDIPDKGEDFPDEPGLAEMDQDFVRLERTNRVDYSLRIFSDDFDAFVGIGRFPVACRGNDDQDFVFLRIHADPGMDEHEVVDIFPAWVAW